jgi:hypothetical protein
MFVFVLVFAILEKAKILGEQAKRLNVVIAGIMGLLFVIPHVMHTYPAGYDPVQIANDSIPDVALIIIGIFCFFLLLAMMSGKGSESLFKPDITKTILFLSVVAVIAIFGGNAGWWDVGFMQQITIEQVGNVAMVMFFLFLIYYVVKGEEKQVHPHRPPEHQEHHRK